jgi:hypothetical protein
VIKNPQPADRQDHALGNSNFAEVGFPPPLPDPKLTFPVDHRHRNRGIETLNLGIQVKINGPVAQGIGLPVLVNYLRFELAILVKDEGIREVENGKN